MKTLIRVARGLSLVLIASLAMCMTSALSPLFAQPSSGAQSPASSEQTSTTTDTQSGELESVEVDWWEQIVSGGMTMLVLGIVSMAGIAFALERALMIREKYICPRKLAASATICVQNNDFTGLHKLATAHPSTLGRIIIFIVEHRENDYEKISSMAETIGAREIIDQEERTFPLAVVAAIAPLLGLLGTMIGMIEAFQMVAVYGDEGGASMLADSIAKALITTAFGLILAIPSIAAFHYFKHKLHKIGVRLELEMEAIITGLFYVKTSHLKTEEIALDEQKAEPKLAPHS
ncbi:MotA/TolQ/ExbB proton channel family protein [Coraliomargarita sp. SDUM461003]|uniref:MotA/TolQ/ExbB proton channel family protein n=1 Tax=Thalassobacterium maritimum TaxID=3041265 RepID=A0ABU1ATJ9_9BACT|nr:MotA/TolQ/ExbB proton channel family protein [Coraliomargarita sp. SDUM461003]MDQ8206302.1 MotA/TolQ/ExbB proton channel family protein [Coraliomargarita sp. SDUM461003]